MRLAIIYSFLALLTFINGRDAVAAHHHDVPPLSLIRFDAAASDAAGAVCLDGSASGIYFHPATTARASKRWVIFIEGGGWCYTLDQCAARARSNLGSSKKWAASLVGYGPYSTDAGRNPLWFDANIVFVPYCDGNSFTGDADAPVVVSGTRLYFRGRRLLDYTLNYLTNKLNLSAATQVLLSGCSAGGLATYQHADYVGQYLRRTVQDPAALVYKAMPISGFFIDYKAAGTAGAPRIYGEEMRTAFKFQNSTGGVHQGCIAHRRASGGDASDCMLAQHVYPFIQTPIFVQQSVYDTWQIEFILGASYGGGSTPEWTACSGGFLGHAGPYKCAADQLAVLNTFADTMQWLLTNTTTWSRPGNAGFVHTCFGHCEGQGYVLKKMADGRVLTDTDAWEEWYFKDNVVASSLARTLPTCRLSAAQPCNSFCKLD